MQEVEKKDEQQKPKPDAPEACPAGLWKAGAFRIRGILRRTITRAFPAGSSIH
jgi:hypothetical protein